MWPNPQKTADLVKFTEKIHNAKLYFLWSVNQELLIAKLYTYGFLKMPWNWFSVICPTVGKEVKLINLLVPGLH